MREQAHHPSTATLIGFGAIVFWASTGAASHTAIASLGTFTTGALVYLFAGAVGFLLLAGRRRLGELRRCTVRHLLGCGSPFILYAVCLHLMVGLAADPRQMVELFIINYLWPGLTLVLSVPLLGRRARWGLLPGMLIAILGVAVVKWPDGSFTLAKFVENAQANPRAYLAAFGCAISWPFYSNLTRRWKEDGGKGAVVIFIFAAGVVMAVLRLVVGETTVWAVPALGAAVYLALLPTLGANLCWDIGMRLGNHALMAALAYTTPILATLISCVCLDVQLEWKLLLASALVVVGAVLCKASVIEPEDDAPSDSPQDADLSASEL